MSTSESRAQARKSIDGKFAEGSLRAVGDRPVRGWIRAVRDALGMTTQQLGDRMGQTQSAVTQLERSEVDDRARLSSLRKAADALGCDLVYAFVPRSTLEDMVNDRARELAKTDLALVNRTMRLEDQAIDSRELDERIDDYAARLVSEGRLWGDGPE